MARQQRRANHGKRATSALLDKGITGIVIGVVMMLLSLMGPSTGPLAGIGRALQTPAWLAIGAGLVLLALHALVHKPPRSEGSPVSKTPRAAMPPELEAVVSDVFGRAEPSLSSERLEQNWGREPAPRATSWSAAVFDAIEWRRFEAVCATLFGQAGFETRTQSHGPDGGVDVWLHSKNAAGAVSVVQCKHWRGKAVGVKEMREFLGVMTAHQMKRGTYVTSSTFTTEAEAFARSHGIHLLDGVALLSLIAQRTSEQQQALLDVAYEGDYARPTCASCGVKMVERSARSSGSRFWGCRHYPKCRNTLPMRAVP